MSSSTIHLDRSLEMKRVQVELVINNVLPTIRTWYQIKLVTTLLLT